MARNKNYKNTKPKTEEEVTIEGQVEGPFDESEVISEPVLGVVSGCSKLNVRKEPKAGSDIVCELEAKTEVMISETESTKDFYRVFTKDGVQGYCMKQYITIIE